MKGHKIPQDIQDEIVSLYNNGYKMQEIANKFNLTDSGVGGVLKKKNIETRNSRSYLVNTFNYDYFNEINSEKTAYWLGFIFADGYISNQGNIVVGLKGEDISHIQKLKSDLNCLNKISKYATYDNRTNNTHEIVKLQFGTLKIANILHSYGLSPNKSLLAYPNLDLIPVELHRHFWRGVFDGDGSIFQRKSRYIKDSYINSWQVYLCGSYAMTLMFYHFLDRLPAYFYHKDSIWYLSYSNRNNISIILDSLYKNANIYLDRKYGQYLRFKELNP